MYLYYLDCIWLRLKRMKKWEEVHLPMRDPEIQEPRDGAYQNRERPSFSDEIRLSQDVVKTWSLYEGTRVNEYQVQAYCILSHDS